MGAIVEEVNERVITRTKLRVALYMFAIDFIDPSMSVLPSEDLLKAALVALKSANPSLGIAKTHARLLETYPTWTVSEKRTRKLLQHEGLVLNGTPTPEVAVYPSSRVIHNLDVHKWTPKVKVKYFDKRKGKGLVATQEIKEGEVIWREDPFILAPEWYMPLFISSIPNQ